MGKVAKDWMRKCELRDVKGEIIRLTHAWKCYFHLQSLLTQKPKADTTPWDEWERIEDPRILGKRDRLK
jgi:hypothetical protein